MGAFPNGAGGGVSATGLAGMWRSVYRKAAAAAEARLQTLLAQHVQERHGRRAIVVVVDGAGAALAAGPGPDVELPWAYVVEGWALYADRSGSAVLDLRVAASYAAFPTVATICAGSPPALAGAQKARGDDVSAWDAALPRGTVLRPVLVSAATVTRLALTLWVRAV